jgi:eukaryotic-like serine/threonine-protein kinase
MGDQSQKKEYLSSVPPLEGSVSFPTSSPPPPLGRERVGRYEIIYPISRGGMASVYAGRLSGIAGFQRLVAIKVVHSHLAAEDKFIKMFLDEARLAAEIQHPNVGEIIEVGQDDGLYYMVGELILGQSLRSVFRRAAQQDMHIPFSVCARIASRVCLGLHAAHELTSLDGTHLGLVHRDVSPRNILMTYDGFVKLIDFGVAYAHGRISHTDVGTLKGKIGYMSPEQLRCESLDRRSDIFSLGVVLYQIVTGRQPFHGKTDIERLNKIMRYEFQKPSDMVPDLDPQLEGIILNAMAQYPDERYATATAMTDDLETYIRSSGENTEPVYISQIMHDLFESEQAYHLERVREYRRNDNATRPILTNPEQNILKTTPNIPRLVLKKSEQPVSSRKRQRSFALMVTIGCALALVALGVFYPQEFTEEHVSGTPAAEAEFAEEISIPALTTAHGVEKHESHDDRRVAGRDIGDPVVDTAAISGAASQEHKNTGVVKVSLEILPTNASVELDGIRLDSATDDLTLPADNAFHRLHIFAKGYRDRYFGLQANKDRTITVSLIPKRQVKKRHINRRAGKVKQADKVKPPKKQKAVVLETSPYQ